MIRKKIKPKISLVVWIILSVFLILSGMLIFNKQDDLVLQFAGVGSLTISIGILWAIDYTHLRLTFDTKELKMVGYFGLRKISLRFDENNCYHISQKVDQYNGLHDEFQLVTKSNDNIIFPRAAYESVYSDIRLLCESNFKLLGFNSLRYGEVLGKVIPIMGLVSGILAALVGLMKFMES